jgi:hypothetical protein
MRGPGHRGSFRRGLVSDGIDRRLRDSLRSHPLRTAQRGTSCRSRRSSPRTWCNRAFSSRPVDQLASISPDGTSSGSMTTSISAVWVGVPVGTDAFSFQRRRNSCRRSADRAGLLQEPGGRRPLRRRHGDFGGDIRVSTEDVSTTCSCGQQQRSRGTHVHVEGVC